MRYKRWCFGMLAAILAVLLFIAGVNYYADLYGYFTYQSGDYADIDFKISESSTYCRVLKANHVLHFGDQYDAYILGGSKTGSCRTEKLQEADGYRYYNLYEPHGTLTEYKTIVDFLLKHTDAKKIIVCMNGREPNRLTYNSKADVMQIPAVWKDEPQIAEYVHFLTLDVTEGLKKLWNEFRNGKSDPSVNRTGGERNLDRQYGLRKADADSYVKKNLLNGLSRRLNTIFTKNHKAPYYRECLNLIRQIKTECGAAGVEVQFWFNPTFLTGLNNIESTYFWNYLRDLAQITDYWIFNGYDDINLNPYNYLDPSHCGYEVSDLMIDTVAGKASYPGFGYHVTRDNVSEYLQQREADYNRLKQEFLETGTVQLPGIDDASYILSREG